MGFWKEASRVQLPERTVRDLTLVRDPTFPDVAKNFKLLGFRTSNLLLGRNAKHFAIL